MSRPKLFRPAAHRPPGPPRPLGLPGSANSRVLPHGPAPNWAVRPYIPGRKPAALLFLSDLTAELDAARAAGWHTIGVRRPGEPNDRTGVGDHHEVASFAAIEL